MSERLNKGTTQGNNNYYERECKSLSCKPDITFSGAFAKLQKATITFVMSVCLSVCPHGTTRLPLDGF